MKGYRTDPGEGGFTLLEVLIAVAILSITLASLLSSQMDALRMSRYAKMMTTVAFLAEYQMTEIEWQIKEEEDGWGDNDKTYEGDFAEQGWPEVSYTCLVDMVEMPDYSALQQAADAADEGGGGDSVQDAGEQAFDAMGMVWPMVKGAIENSIRKVTCTLYWQDGRVDKDFTVETYWTDPSRLNQIPGAGGEVTDDEGGEAEGDEQ